MNYKDECPLSQEEINNLLKALQNDDLTKKVHDMLSNKPEKHQSNDDTGFYPEGDWIDRNLIGDLVTDGFVHYKDIKNLPSVHFTETSKSKENSYDTGYDKEYKDGLNEAWNLIWEIINMSPSQRKEILGDNVIEYIIQRNTASEALEKIKAYEQRIEVGDVVEHKTCFGIVTLITKTNMAHILWEDGGIGIANVKDLRKTSKHYDIQSILDGLGEK